METRTNVLETEVKAAVKQLAVQELHISDIQWKTEDAENRQRGNNLLILGIAEGLEGKDKRTYVVSLFKKAFPDLVGWNWEMEIQRAHLFPLFKKKQGKLYSQEIYPQEDEESQYMANISVGQLQDGDKKELEAPLLDKEVGAAVTALSSGKVAGSDQIPQRIL
ncbi:hypothetical protein NDU88_005459 [Pleurodeles waltl]|uniref:Uncharacterized protein n=1 Tax=Pleurodeles waltl TaxID=8319 RepID=A0AAV7LMU6_PLEWA|nr:hypothetical protein NDU88_005459 [Pleurodeles waltl]